MHQNTLHQNLKSAVVRFLLPASLSNLVERLHGRTVKALANHFGGPGSIPSAGCSEREPGCEIFAPVPDAALNGCELHVKPDFNFNFKSTQVITQRFISNKQNNCRYDITSINLSVHSLSCVVQGVQ